MITENRRLEIHNEVKKAILLWLKSDPSIFNTSEDVITDTMNYLVKKCHSPYEGIEAGFYLQYCLTKIAKNDLLNILMEGGEDNDTRTEKN